ncbi:MULTISPECIES: flavoprotein [unclassified Brenneria]|uniref:flavoprotein n=1 Tax=unclassified Brenneria TaxID=2634434 RepID=UPI0029C35566|nr:MULTISPECIES: flavoprotein [unclassified Brenneria]MDX5630837.1 hypothetical protein [Brenneria sp. L3-3Z]MDX5697919.1 hypothetical protein [Brenneria sp. L4-2C]
MDQQRLSQWLDASIDELLARRQRRLQNHRVMRVVLSGEDLSTLPETLDCFTALNRSGYLLLLTFSHSAAESSLQTACLQGLVQRGIDALCDNRDPCRSSDEYCGLYLPALSSNSMSKIALGLRDNLVCRWACHALSQNKQVIVTLNAECRESSACTLPPAFKARLSQYAQTLVEYGFTVIGHPVVAGDAVMQSAGSEKALITLSDVRRTPAGQPIYIRRGTLITPAARDEIRDRGITIIQPPRREYVSG